MIFNFKLMKQEREKYAKDTFDKILKEIHEQIKIKNSIAENKLEYSPLFFSDEIRNLNYKWDKRKDLKKYVFVLKNEGFKVKIKHHWDSGVVLDESYYYLYIEW